MTPSAAITVITVVMATLLRAPSLSNIEHRHLRAYGTLSGVS
jgi:hypothetical protein